MCRIRYLTVLTRWQWGISYSRRSKNFDVNLAPGKENFSDPYLANHQSVHNEALAADQMLPAVCTHSVAVCSTLCHKALYSLYKSWHILGDKLERCNPSGWFWLVHSKYFSCVFPTPSHIRFQFCVFFIFNHWLGWHQWGMEWIFLSAYV